MAGLLLTACAGQSAAAGGGQLPGLALTLPTPASSPAFTPTSPSRPSPATSTPFPTLEPEYVSDRVARVTGIGDSVMLGAAGELHRLIDDLNIDAAHGRQVEPALQVLRRLRDAGRLGAIVIIHVGNNGTFDQREFDQMMQLLAQVPKVLVVNLTVPRVWQDDNNAVLDAGVKRYPNAVLIDWHGASVGRPDLFYEDGVHLRPAGARVYADLIAGVVGR